VIEPDVTQQSTSATGRFSLVASVTFVATMATLWWATGATTLVVYAVSFWHYLIYVLAFAFRAVRLTDFRRDAILMRSVSLVALGAVYFDAPLDALSLLVAGTGLLLNIAAVRALGTERTYYGSELAGLPPRRVTAFPYSVMLHPMLIGNMAAYLGVLLHPDFRAHWWPLAAAHVLLNGVVIILEACAAPHPPQKAAPLRTLLIRIALWASLGAAFGVGASFAGAVSLFTGMIAGASMAAYAGALFEAYSTSSLHEPFFQDRISSTNLHRHKRRRRRDFRPIAGDVTD